MRNVASRHLRAGLQHNNATNLSQDPNVQVMLPAFTVYNAKAACKFKAGSRDCKARRKVKNIFDKRYREGCFAPSRTICLSPATKF